MRSGPKEDSSSQDRLQRMLGYRFVDPELLTRALSHRSWCAESAAAVSNERLEFLGDAVIALVVSDVLMRLPEGLPEGEMTKVRAQVASAPVLAHVAAEIGVGDAVLLGRGELLSGGRSKQSILCNALEAVVGAVYLDGGFEAAFRVVRNLLADALEGAVAGVPGSHDHKTRLQERAAALGMGLPVYSDSSTGPDHAKTFTASVSIDGTVYGKGSGRSKKQAEQAAAAVALVKLEESNGSSTGKVA